MLDRDEMLAYMRLRGKLNALIADFMTNYAACRTGKAQDLYDERWHWLWALGDLQKINLVKAIVEQFGSFDAQVNTQEEYTQARTVFDNMLSLFSITQLTASLGKPSAV